MRPSIPLRGRQFEPVPNPDTVDLGRKCHVTMTRMLARGIVSIGAHANRWIAPRRVAPVRIGMRFSPWPNLDNIGSCPGSVVYAFREMQEVGCEIRTLIKSVIRALFTPYRACGCQSP